MYEFSSLCFRLGLASLVFTKAMKFTIFLTRKLNVKIIYLDDMLLLGRTREDLLKAMNSLIVLLQNLGFIVHEII